MKSMLLSSCLVVALAGMGCAQGAVDADPEGVAPAPTSTGGDGSSTTVTPAAPTSPDGGKAAASDGGGDPTPSSCASTGSLAAFDLGGLSGTTTDVTASSTASGVTASVLKRVGLKAESSSGAINASNWPTGSVDKGKYYTFSVTPPAGCALDVSALAIELSSSGTGPTKASIGTSADGYGALRSAAIGSAVDVSLPGASGVSGALEIRIYGFEAQSTSGTMRIEGTLTLDGALAPAQ